MQNTIARQMSGNLSPAGLFSARRPLRLAYFVSHPIQYQAPLLKRIAQEPDIELKVFFSSTLSVKAYLDPGFGVPVQWDVPLLEGYQHEFLPALSDSRRLGVCKPVNYGVRRILREQGFHAVWTHGYGRLTELQAIVVAHAMGLPVLLRAEPTLMNLPRSRKTLAAKRIFFSWLRKRVAAAMAIGEANAAYWRHYLGETFPIFPFKYAVDNDFFQRECARAAQTREEFRRSLGLHPGRPVILFASKLQPGKRCIDLLEAYLQITETGAPDQAPYLLIIGDGEERAALEARARQAIPGNVHFLGFRNQTELPRFYDLCNVFVLAAVYEAWGLVVNEVMNAGRPVIVSDQVGCHRDLVQDGVNGYVIKPYSPRDLARALDATLRDEAWRKMGAESLRIVSNYSFEQNVVGLRQALQQVVPGFEATPA